MVSQTREALFYRDSRDPKVSAAGIEVRMGRKWRADEALEVVESRLRQRELVGNVARGQACLGYFHQDPDSQSHRQRETSTSPGGSSTGVEEERPSRLVGLRQKEYGQGKNLWSSEGSPGTTSWSRLLQSLFPDPGCVRWPTKPFKSPLLGQDQNTICRVTLFIVIPEIVWPS